MSILLSRKEAAIYLRDTYGAPVAVAAVTLAKFAVYGHGPSFCKIGRRVGYTHEALDAFAQSRIGTTIKQTSELKSVVRHD